MPDDDSIEKDIEEPVSSSDTMETNETADEEETQAESDSREQAPKNQANQKTRSGNIIAPLGDNTHITINYFHTILRDVEKQSLYGNSDDEDTKGIYLSKEELIKQNLAFERQNTPQFDDPTPSANFSQKDLPQGIDGLSQWYYGLNEFEQCYVQATAILHGASAHEISKRAHRLYRFLQEQLEQNDITSESEMQQEFPQRHLQRLPFRRQPGLELREHTRTTMRRVKGVERIFWQDVDDYGLSQFGPSVLIFLTSEFISKGEHGESFFNVIQSWSQEKKGECYWRAARALGVILWYQDIYQLRTKAVEWAKRSTIHGRRQTASLLDGAREIEIIQQQEHAEDRQNSSVLQLLNEWIERIAKEPIKTNISIGCAAANAYGLIGKKSPEAALRGMGRLLELQQNKDTDDNRAFFAAGVSAYVSVTWSGYMRNVLAHLANIAEQLLLHWSPPPALEMRQISRLQREARLRATFEAFFLVAAAASPAEQEKTLDVYTQPLAEQITTPDPYKRNILLVAILTEDSAKKYILTLLCSAIVSMNGKPAFELIRQWAGIVAVLQPASSQPSKQLYDTFIQFLVDLGNTIDTWCGDLTKQGYRTSVAGEVYKHKLEHWHKEGIARKHTIEQMAHEVLLKLYKR
jgi:hypothetical protein